VKRIHVQIDSINNIYESQVTTDAIFGLFVHIIAALALFLLLL